MMSPFVTDDFDIKPMPKHSERMYFLTQKEQSEINKKNDESTDAVKQPMPEHTILKI
jgi:hypothetical protein